MSSSEFITITGFKSFTSMWFDACELISQETIPETVDNDIKLFEILRAVMLSKEQPVFIRSYKLSDFNNHTNIQNILKTPYNQRAHVSWKRVYKPYPSQPQPSPRFKIAPNTPAPVSYLRVNDTKIVSALNFVKIHDNCIFKPAGTFETPIKKEYTVIKNDFIVRLDDTSIFYPVSSEIMNMFANNQRNSITLKTFQEQTDKMHKTLLEKRAKMK